MSEQPPEWVESPLERIEALDRELDLFPEGPAPADELVAGGFHPPLPIGGEILIWGHRLVRAARRLGVPRLPCRLVEMTEPVDLLALALRLEDRAGRYTWEEKERMLAWLARRAGDRPDSWLRLEPLIEGAGRARVFAGIRRYDRLSAPLQAMVRRGRLDLKSAARLDGLPADVFELLERAEAGGPGSGPAVRLSSSERRILLEELREAARRSGRDPADLLRRALQAVDPREEIRRLRRPELAALEDRFAALRRRLLDGTGIRLAAPAGFEGDGFQVSFSFESRQALRGRLAALGGLEERSDELFDLLA
jgi:hypothetical protein